RLVVKSWNRGRACVHGKRVAFQADEVNLGALQQPWVRGTVRRMASCAAFDFYRFVLIDKWSSFVRMAFETDRVLRCSWAQLRVKKAAVRVMAIDTLHEAFVDAMVKRLIELQLRFQMAAVAKCRRFFFHQMLRLFRTVRGVTVNATDVVLQMS